MLYQVSEVKTFGAGLDHPEGIAVARDDKLYTGGEAGQIYRIPATERRLKSLRTLVEAAPSFLSIARHRFSFFASVADAKSCVCRMRHIVSEKIFACALCGTWQASSIAW
jgi:hypothetical protein